eukprot:TRINITY_DN42865_c0_g1_i1.p1 TRINITY_DN42865_c0_g1~~TRINITY_DN42865_c0_g1_i1.p1  ORF type:complete len:125 (+),score=11.11 TRINITY_DN42865_c0_g1_i1:163-537(+)
MPFFLTPTEHVESGALARALTSSVTIPLPGKYYIDLKGEKIKAVATGLAIGCAVGFALQCISRELKRRDEETRAAEGAAFSGNGRRLGGKPITTDRGYSSRRSTRLRNKTKSELDFLKKRPPKS